MKAESKSVIVVSCVLFVVMLLIIYQLANNIEQLEKRVSSQMIGVTKQWIRLTAVDNKIITLQKETEKHRLTANSLSLEVNQLQDDLKTLSDKHEAHHKLLVEQLTKLYEEKQRSIPISDLIPQEELEKMSYLRMRTLSSYDEGALLQVTLINESAWTVKSLVVERYQSGSSEVERYSFEFKELIPPTHQGSASVKLERYIDYFDSYKWRIISGVGYKGYWSYKTE